MSFRNLLSVLLFSLVAVASFSIWAWGGQWFNSEPALYAACAAVFLGLGGLAFSPSLSREVAKPLRFCIAFALAYLCYAVIWSVVWFSMKSTFGEILGSSLGLTAFVFVIARFIGPKLSSINAISLLFLFHSLGYYAGEFAYETLRGSDSPITTLGLERDTIVLLARLAWGFGYGAG
ncbi:MAG: hypothetical protein AAF357_10725, partial [Verrucomicrobiota bacterium]